MLRLRLMSGLLTISTLCVACSDNRDRLGPVAGDSTERRALPGQVDSMGRVPGPSSGRPEPFDSSYEHFIQTIPGDELDSMSMPTTPEESSR